MTGPGNADRAAWAAQAIEAFRSAAGPRAGLDTAEVIGSLITALCHHADRRGISFGPILTASSDAYLSQRASEQHAYKVGDEVRIRDSAVLSPSLATLPRLGIVAALYPSAERTQQYAIRFPGEINAMPFTGPEIEPAPPFQPVRTRQGTRDVPRRGRRGAHQHRSAHPDQPPAQDPASQSRPPGPAAARVRPRPGMRPDPGGDAAPGRDSGHRESTARTRDARRQRTSAASTRATGTRPFQTEPETAARLADVLQARKDAPLPGAGPGPHELLREYRFAFGYEKAGLRQPRPSRSQRDTASPAELAGRDFPAPGSQPTSAPQ